LKPGRRGPLSAIVGFSLRRRGVIIALAIAFFGYGIYTLTGAAYDVFPEFAPPRVVVHTEAPGFSPGQVEALITRPVESAINGVGGIDSLLSKSVQGLSVVTVRFKTGTDIYLARQKVAERLSALTGQLPLGATPHITPLTSSTGTVLVVGLASDKLTQLQLRTVADWTVKQRLLAVPGVSKIAVFGGEVKQFQVQVQPSRLIKYNLSMDDVIRAARQATGMKGAGFIENENQRILLRTEGQALSPGELGRTVIVHEKGANVTLADVAKVVEAPAPAIGGGAIDGRPGIILSVSAQYGANTLEVTHGLEEAVKELRPSLQKQGIKLYPRLFRPADFIETALHNVKTSLIIGAVLVMLVLFLYLFNLRTAAISCTAIPLSLLAAVTVMERMGFSLNTMTMGGLAIAIGEVVDDAVIDVENIFRRLRENRALERPLPALQVVFDASVEVRSAVVYATFAVVLVFIPVLTMSGLAGRLFAPLGLTYILAILSSLVVALTVTPALSLAMLGRRDMSPGDPPVVRWTKERYRKLLLGVENHPRTVIGIAAVVAISAAAALPFLGGSFLPGLIEGNFIVHVSSVPGTSLAETLRTGDRIATDLLRLPYVRSISQRAGRAEEGEEARGTEASEFGVSLRPMGKKRFELARKEIRGTLQKFPGINYSIDTFLTERINETISGYTAPVVVNIYGNDLDILDEKAAEIAGALSRVPGAVGVRLESPPAAPELLASLRKPDLSRWGFDPVNVLDDVHTAFAGKVVGQVYDDDRVVNVSVVLDPEARKNITDAGMLRLRSPGGAYVELKQLADLREMPSRSIVLHEGARRVQTITCNVTGKNVSSFVARAKKLLSGEVTLPPGTYMDFTGSAASQARTRKDLLVHSLIAALGIVMLLSMVTGHYRNLLLLLLNLPFALAGGVFIALMTGGFLSIGSIVGFVTLFGITLRNSVMLISHYEHLVDVEGMHWNKEAAMRGASERLAPILLTASVTALGLLPLALGSGAPGREIEGPMAQIILGGLVTSTLLNLLVLPSLALRFGRFGKMHFTAETQSSQR
jgi:CzcA family heavy metal efflux pump